MNLCMAMLSFLAPWWAAGAIAAAGLPLLAHLLSRTKYRPVLFPATRLVRRAVEQAHRIERPRSLLLMLMRILLLMFLVLAFMRPSWLPDALAGSGEEGLSVIVLVDASASMSRVRDGANLYDRAVREAGKLLGKLDPSRDVAAVIRVDRSPEALLAEPTARFSILQQRLEATSPGYETTNWSAARAMAQRLASASPQRTQLVVISDEQGDKPELALEDWPAPLEIQHLRLGGPADNSALRLIDLAPYPPIAGQPVSATLELQHYGTEGRKITLNAALGDASVQRQIALGGNARQRLVVMFPPVDPGPSVLRLSIEAGDAMPADDLAGLPLNVQEQTRAVVVHDGAADSVSLARRISTLLRPDDVARLSLPVVDVMSGANFVKHVMDSDPALLRTVVLISSGEIPVDLAATLNTFSERGGGVIVVKPTPGRTGRSAGGIDFDHPALRVFEGPARAGLAGLVWPDGVHFRLDEDASVILSTSDGRPIISERALGRGRGITFHRCLSPGPGGLLAEPAFVVLFNELCRYASPGPSVPAPARPGDPLPNMLLDAAQLSIPNEADRGADVVTAPGTYLAFDAQGGVVDGFWAAVDPSESDTTPSREWAESTSRTVATQAVDGGNPDLAQAIRPTPVELWPYLIFGALLLAAGESAMLWHFAKPGGAGA